MHDSFEAQETASGASVRMLDGTLQAYPKAGLAMASTDSSRSSSMYAYFVLR